MLAGEACRPGRTPRRGRRRRAPRRGRARRGRPCRWSACRAGSRSMWRMASRATRSRGGDQHGRRVGAVLGLAEQVDGDDERVGARRRRPRGSRSDRRTGRCRPRRTAGAWPPRRRRCPGPRSGRPGRCVSVPIAIAATAWTPPSRKISSAPARCRAATVAAGISPRIGGVHARHPLDAGDLGGHDRHVRRRGQRVAAARHVGPRRPRSAGACGRARTPGWVSTSRSCIVSRWRWAKSRTLACTVRMSSITWSGSDATSSSIRSRSSRNDSGDQLVELLGVAAYGDVAVGADLLEDLAHHLRDVGVAGAGRAGADRGLQLGAHGGSPGWRRGWRAAGQVRRPARPAGSSLSSAPVGRAPRPGASRRWGRSAGAGGAGRW